MKCRHRFFFFFMEYQLLSRVCNAKFCNVDEQYNDGRRFGLHESKNGGHRVSLQQKNQKSHTEFWFERVKMADISRVSRWIKTLYIVLVCTSVKKVDIGFVWRWIKNWYICLVCTSIKKIDIGLFCMKVQKANHRSVVPVLKR